MRSQIIILTFNIRLIDLKLRKLDYAMELYFKSESTLIDSDNLISKLMHLAVDPSA